MKIIKVGNFDNVFPMTITCQKVVDQYGFSYGDTKDFCGSEIEIEAEDVKAHKWDKYPDYSGVDYGFICPVCGKFIVVDKNLIPKKILDAAEEICVGNNR